MTTYSIILSLFVLTTYCFYMYNIYLSSKIYSILTVQSLFQNVFTFIFVSLTGIKDLLIKNFNFLPVYYKRNENLWVDGFLFDFLQKKSTDLWIRKFVIYTGFIFSERLVFDVIIRIYLDNLLWPLHYVGLFETNNILEMLVINVFFYFFLFALLVFLYICLF